MQPVQEHTQTHKHALKLESMLKKQEGAVVRSETWHSVPRGWGWNGVDLRQRKPGLPAGLSFPAASDKKKKLSNLLLAKVLGRIDQKQPRVDDVAVLPVLMRKALPQKQAHQDQPHQDLYNLIRGSVPSNMAGENISPGLPFTYSFNISS